MLGGDPKVEVKSELDPRVFFTGPVRLNLGAESHQLKTGDLETLVQRNGMIFHVNGQLNWDTRSGVVMVNIPLSQGVCGFLSGAETGKIQFQDIRIESENEYAAIIAVSMDGKPLSESAFPKMCSISGCSREIKLHAAPGRVRARGSTVKNRGVYPSCSAIRFLASSTASCSLEGSLPPAWARSAFPPPPPPQSLATGPISLPAWAPLA